MLNQKCEIRHYQTRGWGVSHVDESDLRQISTLHVHLHRGQLSQWYTDQIVVLFADLRRSNIKSSLV